jgi:hypothetical protein
VQWCVGAARGALSAGRHRQRGDAVADAERHAGTLVDDLAGVFVAERGPDGHIERAATRHVQVRAADTAAVDADQRLVRPRLWDRQVLDHELTASPTEDRTAHVIFSYLLPPQWYAS